MGLYRFPAIICFLLYLKENFIRFIFPFYFLPLLFLNDINYPLENWPEAILIFCALLPSGRFLLCFCKIYMWVESGERKAKKGIRSFSRIDNPTRSTAVHLFLLFTLRLKVVVEDSATTNVYSCPSVAYTQNHSTLKINHSIRQHCSMGNEVTVTQDRARPLQFRG